MIESKQLKRFDWLFFAAALVLSGVGIMMIYSTGLAGGNESTLWLRQIVFLAIGLVGMFFFGTLDYRFFRKNSSVIYIGAIMLLALVLFVGQDIRGSRRWFDLGVANFQPAELSKLALVVLLAKYFQVSRPFLQKARG